MNIKEFHNDSNENLRECIRLIESLLGVVELTTYGVAPNPNGFFYEILKDAITLGERRKIKFLDRELDSLSKNQEAVIKELYL